MKLASIKNIIGAFVAAAALAGSVKAGQVEGQIQFSSPGATTDTGSLVTASVLYIVNPATVTFGSIDYAGIVGDNQVVFMPGNGGSLTPTPGVLTLNPAALDVGQTLWTTTVSGVTYAMTINTVDAVSQFAIGGVEFLNIQGTGMATISGDTPMTGIYSITDTGSTGNINFSFGANVSVPDSGTTTLLIVLGMAGVGLGVLALRRESAKA